MKGQIFADNAHLEFWTPLNMDDNVMYFLEEDWLNIYFMHLDISNECDFQMKAKHKKVNNFAWVLNY